MLIQNAGRYYNTQLPTYHPVICRTQIAAIFEFAGALLLGRVNTNVIAGGIANINAFTQTPEIYACVAHAVHLCDRAAQARRGQWHC